MTDKQFSSDMELSSTQGFECAIYARYSCEKQRESSIEDQVRECREAARRIGGYVPDGNIFADREICGASKDRLALNQVQSIVRSGRATFSDLFVADTSRLARDTELASKLRKFFEFQEIRLHFVDNGMKSGSSGFNLQHTVQSYFDEHYSEQLGNKVLRGQEGRILAGYTCSGRCYGYRNAAEEHPTRVGLYGRPEIVGVRKVIHAEEAKTVREVFRMYAAGEGGYNYIARQLNERGVLSPRKARKNMTRGWDHATIRKMLMNERYCGRVIFGRMKTVRDPESGKIKHRKRPSSEWITYNDPSLRIVSEDLWEAVHRQREFVRKKSGWAKSGGMSRTDHSRNYLFSGLLRCGSCGGTMTMANGPRGCYYCSSARRHTGCQSRQRIRRRSLEKHLIDRIASTLRSSVKFAELKSLFQAELFAALKQREEQHAGAAGRKADLLAEQKQLNSELANLAEEIAKFGGTDAIRSVMRDRQARLNGVTELIVQAGMPPVSVSEEEVTSFLRQAIDELSEILQAEPRRTKMELQRRISSLTLTPTTHDGQPAFRVSGDLSLFSGDEPVLPGLMVDSTTGQHAVNLPLDGIVLVLDDHAEITEIIDAQPMNTVYSLAQVA